MFRRGDFAKLAARDLAGNFLLLETAICLVGISAAIRLVSFHKIAKFLDLTEIRADLSFSAPNDPKIQDIAHALRIVDARIPWTCTCLCQALAGIFLLSRRGFPAILHLGVSKGATTHDALLAHAWLDCGAINIMGGETAASFTLLARFAAKTLMTSDQNP